MSLSDNLICFTMLDYDEKVNKHAQFWFEVWLPLKCIINIASVSDKYNYIIWFYAEGFVYNLNIGK